MGSFDEHMNAAPATGLSLLAGVAGFIGVGWKLAIGAAVGAYLFTYLGAAFPDIDHHSSIPFRYFKQLMMFVAAAGALWLLWKPVSNLMAQVWTTAVSITSQGGFVFGLGQFYIALLLGVGVVVIVVMGLVGALIEILRPKHRGITHKRGTGILISSAVVLGVYFVANQFVIRDTAIALGIVTGFANYVGVLSHLRLDGILD